MKASKKFKIQELVFFWGVKTHFGKHVFRQEKKYVTNIMSYLLIQLDLSFVKDMSLKFSDFFLQNCIVF